jgi:chromosome segregation ATPase
MIRTVKLRNFQSHKDSTFEFPDGISSLTGSSNSGKSSILRGIGWVLNNRPSGESFVSYWARDGKGKQIDETSVSITFDTGDVVERIRSKTENIYKINGKSLEAIGLAVPEEVQKVCNMSEVNFQSQMDAPFLLSESAGEVARFFNKLIHLDVIDQYLSLIDSKKRKTKAEKETNKGNLERVEKELGQYTWTDKAEALIAKAEKLEFKIVSLTTDKNNLQQTFAILEKMKDILEQTSCVTRAEEILSTLKDLVYTQEKLEAQIEGIHSSIEDFLKQAKILAQTKDIDVGEKLCNRAIKLYTIVKETQEEVEKMDTSKMSYVMNRNILDTFDKEFTILQKQLPNVCPLCGGTIHE